MPPFEGKFTKASMKLARRNSTRILYDPTGVAICLTVAGGTGMVIGGTILGIKKGADMIRARRGSKSSDDSVLESPESAKLLPSEAQLEKMLAEGMEAKRTMEKDEMVVTHTLEKDEKLATSRVDRDAILEEEMTGTEDNY